MVKGSQGGGCQAWGSCRWDFLLNVGELPFFCNCTLKERSLEPPLKIGVRSQRPAWGGEDPGGVRRGVQPHLLSTKRQGHCGAETRHSAGAEGAASQGRCSLLFSTVSRGGDHIPSQNSKRASCRLSLPALPRDQIRIFTSQPTNHFKTRKKYGCYERALWYPQGVLSCSHAIPWCPAEWELGERFLKAD